MSQCKVPTTLDLRIDDQFIYNYIGKLSIENGPETKHRENSTAGHPMHDLDRPSSSYTLKLDQQ